MSTSSPSPVILALRKWYRRVILGLPDDCPFIYARLVHSSPPYIPLKGKNQTIALSYILSLNSVLFAESAHNDAPMHIIPVRSIVFQAPFPAFFSRVICNPSYSFSYRERYPFQLVFGSDSEQPVNFHGSIYFDASWSVQSAEYCYWNHGDATFFYFNKIDGNLILYKVEKPYSDGTHYPIYECYHIIHARDVRKHEEDDYNWLLSHYPGKCPKTVSSYRRMKTQYTKNFQLLEQFAESNGRKLTNIGNPSPIY